VSVGSLYGGVFILDIYISAYTLHSGMHLMYIYICVIYVCI
jgi:hypothetical protein